MIESFEARFAESRAEAAQAQEQLAAATQQLEAAQLRVRELVDAKGRLRRDAEGAAAGAAGAEAALRQELEGLRAQAAQCEPLRRQVAELEAQLAGARGELATAQAQQQTLLDTVDAANDAIMVGAGGCCCCCCTAGCFAWAPAAASCY